MQTEKPQTSIISRSFLLSPKPMVSESALPSRSAIRMIPFPLSKARSTISPFTQPYSGISWIIKLKSLSSGGRQASICPMLRAAITTL